MKRVAAWVGMTLFLGLAFTAGEAWAQNGRGLLERESGLDVQAVTLEEGLSALRRTAGVGLAFNSAEQSVFGTCHGKLRNSSARKRQLSLG